MSSTVWNCIRCTLENPAKSQTCSACSAKKPKHQQLVLPLKFSFKTSTVAWKDYDVAPNTTFAFMRDIIEAKTGIPDKEQILYVGDGLTRIRGDGSKRLTNLVKLSPTEVNVVVVRRDGEALTAEEIATTDSKIVPWLCPKCTFSNKEDFFVCQVCTEKRVDFTTAQTLPPVVVNAAAQAEADTKEAPDNSVPGGPAIDEEADAFDLIDAADESMQPDAAEALSNAPSDIPSGDDWGDDDDRNDGWEVLGDDTAKDGGDGWGGIDDKDWSMEAGIGLDVDKTKQDRNRQEIDEQLMAIAGEEQKSVMIANPNYLMPVGAGNDDFLDDPNALIKNMVATKPYLILTPLRVDRYQSQLAAEFAELSGLTTEDAFTALRGAQWRFDELLQQWMADSKKCREKYGVPVGGSPVNGKLDMCLLCGDDDIPAGQWTALGCNHQFCNNCWQSWLRAEFDKGALSIFARCPMHKCTAVTPTHIQRKFLTPKQFAKHKNYLTDSFVQGALGVKWCPSPGCVRAVASINSGAMGIACACGHTWCFGCGIEDHRPMTCDGAKVWNDKNESEGENLTWIKANTKTCPKCKVHIEKNQGCNHMTCRKCRHEFCWLCKGNWQSHSNCAKFDDVKKEEDDSRKAKNEMEKYMHYYTRFDNHAKSIKFAEKTRLEAHTRAVELQSLKGAGAQNVKFLLDATESIIRSHRVLQWTYAYGYLLKAKNTDTKRILFNQQQAKLEEFNDRLHELVEQPLEKLKSHAARTEILNLTNVVEKYRGNVIDAIESHQ